MWRRTPRPPGFDEAPDESAWYSVKRYNVCVPLPERQSDLQEHSPKHHHHAIYASETTGLLLIAFLLLVLTLIRYWHDIHWSLR